MPNPPANLILTPKMVGGKEVQLVTPNVGARRPPSRPTVRPIHGQPIGPNQIQVSRSSGPVGNDNSSHHLGRYPSVGAHFRAPMGVPVRPPVHQQPHKPAVNLRKAVGGAEKPPPPPQQKSSLIKLTKSTIRDTETKTSQPTNNMNSPADSKAINEVGDTTNHAVNDDEVSTRQLAENWLHTGASRKFAKQKEKQKTNINLSISKATEKILDMTNNKVPLKTNNHKIDKKSKGR